MVKVAPVFVHAPELLYATASPELDVAATVNCELYAPLPGAGVPTLIVWFAMETVSEFVPVLVIVFESPAKVALTPVGYVLGAIVPRLALESVATPEPLVVPLPTDEPLREKSMLLPLTPPVTPVKVADILAVPP